LAAYHARFAPLFPRAEQRHGALLYLRGQLLLDELISEVIDLGEVNQGLAALDGSDGARSVIHFD